MGPELVASGERLVAGNAFLGAVQGAFVLFLVALALLLAMRQTEATEGAAAVGEARPIREILQAPLFRLAVAAGVVGQGVMVFIMTATPVSMHVMDGHDLATTAGVIRAHVLAMYIPSLVSGLLIARFGERTLMLWGVAALLATLAFGLSGHAVMHYTSALVLLGVGWNFLFVGGTTLLVKSYRPSERYRAQAVNEAAVFGTSATESPRGHLAHVLRLDAPASEHLTDSSTHGFCRLPASKGAVANLRLTHHALLLKGHLTGGIQIHAPADGPILMGPGAPAGHGHGIEAAAPATRMRMSSGALKAWRRPSRWKLP